MELDPKGEIESRLPREEVVLSRIFSCVVLEDAIEKFGPVNRRGVCPL